MAIDPYRNKTKSQRTAYVNPKTGDVSISGGKGGDSTSHQRSSHDKKISQGWVAVTDKASVDKLYNKSLDGNANNSAYKQSLANQYKGQGPGQSRIDAANTRLKQYESWKNYSAPTSGTSTTKTKGSGSTSNNRGGGGFSMDSYVSSKMNASRARRESEAVRQKGLIDDNVANAQLEADRNTRTANQNFEGQQKDIRQNTYQNIESGRVQGTQRGVIASQQQAGMEQGVRRHGTSLESDALSNRDNAILGIKERIANIRNSANREKANIDAITERNIAEDTATAEMEATRRQWQLEDAQSARDFQREQTANQQNFTRDMAQMENTFKQNAVADNQAFQTMMTDKGYAHDLSKLNLNFEQQENMLGLQQSFSKEMNQLDYNQSVSLAGMNNAMQKDLMKLQHKDRVSILGMEQSNREALQKMQDKSKMKFMAYDRETKEAFFNMEANKQFDFFNMDRRKQEKFMALDKETQIEMMELKDGFAQEDFQRRIDAENENRKFQMVNEILMAQGVPFDPAGLRAWRETGGDAGEAINLVDNLLKHNGIEGTARNDIMKSVVGTMFEYDLDQGSFISDAIKQTQYNSLMQDKGYDIRSYVFTGTE